MHTDHMNDDKEEECELCSHFQDSRPNKVPAHDLMSREIDICVSKRQEDLTSEYLHLHCHFDCQMKIPC